LRGEQESVVEIRLNRKGIPDSSKWFQSVEESFNAMERGSGKVEQTGKEAE
jgi:hypothetical protein